MDTDVTVIRWDGNLRHMSSKFSHWPTSVWSTSLVGVEQVPGSLPLLGQPYLFSQTGLLDEYTFAREAQRRGVRLTRDTLEQAHRRGLLVPLFRIHERRVERPESRRPAAQSPGVAWWLYRAGEQGLLRDPSQHRFRPWGRKQLPGRRSGHFYSQYQLLALRHLSPLLTQMTIVVDDKGERRQLPRFRPSVVDAFQRMRALAIVLEVLAPRYLPRVLGMLRSPTDDMHYFIDDREPSSEQAFLNLEPDLLLRQAERLLGHASTFDPLGDWHRVVRIGDPRRWEGLRFDALVAVEHRIAAELLLQFCEDLKTAGTETILTTKPGRVRSLERDRIVVDGRERAATLLGFRLTSTPAVTLAVEGETEMRVVPRVLSMMGVNESAGLIQLVDLRGVDGDIRLLARSVAVPRLDTEGPIKGRILRPLTALFVAADGEHGYATKEQCERKRQEVVDELMTCLPKLYRTTGMRKDLEYLVRIRHWGVNQTFEFAHFSDRELATAIQAAAKQSAPSFDKIVEAVHQQRLHQRRLENVWKGWLPPRPSKPRLADLLWHVLEEKLLDPHRAKQLPLVDVLKDVIDLALQVRPVTELQTEA